MTPLFGELARAAVVPWSVTRATDQRGFSAVYRRWLPFVRRAVARQSVRPDDIDDVAQEVFVLMLRKLAAPYGHDDNVRGWLYETARRVANNHRRGRGRHERKVAAVRVVAEGAEEGRAEAHAEGCAAVLRLQRLLGAFDAQERVAFELAVVAGGPARVVADALGVKPHAAYQLIHRVRAQIDDAIDPVAVRGGRLRAFFAWFRPEAFANAGWPAAASAALVLAVLPSPVPRGEPGAAAQSEPAAVGVREAPTASGEPVIAAAVSAMRGERSVTAWTVAAEPAQTSMRVPDGESFAAGGGGAPRTVGPGPLASGRGGRPRHVADPQAELLAALEGFEPTQRERPAAIEGFEPARGELLAALEAFQPAPARMATALPSSKEVARSAGAVADAPPESGYWRGRFVRADGSPVANAAVRCRRRTAAGTRRRCFGRGEPTPVTDARGRLVLGPMPAGTYELAAFDAGAVASAGTTIVVAVH